MGRTLEGVGEKRRKVANGTGAAAHRQRLSDGIYTSPALISLDYIPPPEDLAPFVTTFFHLRCDETEILDIQPAGVGILAVFMRGQGEIFIRDGHTDPSHVCNILTPTAAAAPIAVDGPWHAFGASLSPLGWAALSGRLSAARHGNRLLEAGGLFGSAFTAMGERIREGYCAGELDVAAMLAIFAETLRPALRPVPQAHVRLMATVAEWLGESLSPVVERLQQMALYSPRQLQRLADQYFGLPPKQLARKYRAIRAAAVLADPATSQERADMIADQFYDQSHMIREISLFAGRTPARLGNPETPILSALLDLRNFRELTPRVAPLPESFGG